MRNKCLICDKKFTNEELLKKHEEKHLDESILNQPKENFIKTDVSFQKKNKSVNIKKIFSEEKFEKLIESKMINVSDVKEIATKQNFIEQIKKINRKNSFCYIPYFVKDFISGTSLKDLENKYHISYWMDLYNISNKILGFSEERYTSRKYDNALELNLKIINWNKKYQELKVNCEFFRNEIDELIFDNILQAKIIFSLMDKELEKNEIATECKELKNQYDLFHFIDESLANSFNKILEDGLENRINNILSGLKEEKIVTRSTLDPKKLTVVFSINKIKKYIIRELKIKEKIAYVSLQTKTLDQFPALKLIPKFGVFDTAWTELEKEGIIHIEYRSSRGNDFIIFLNEDYLKIQKEIQSLDTDANKIPFKGRKITPEQFIEELLELEKGDFEDADDQVTRLAGLFLAESVKLQSTHEDIPEFDFRINLTNYDFRSEQSDVMKKLNLKINSEIFHVKVMINENLNLTKYNELKGKLPEHEQAIIITFEKIPSNIKKLLENDPTIQVIDKEGVKIWVSITSRLPARVNSLCKIYQDPLSRLENKLVRVNSIFYETGIALVNIIPEMNEATVLARCLQEIPLFESKASDFELYSKNYLKFLKILSSLAKNDDLIQGFFEQKIIGNPQILRRSFEFNFGYNTVKIYLSDYNKKNIINCSCMQWQENPLYLCPHLISALDHTARMKSFLDESWENDQNYLNSSLVAIMGENMSLILDKLGMYDDECAADERLKISNFIFGISKLKESD